MLLSGKSQIGLSDSFLHLRACYKKKVKINAVVW